MAAKLGRRIPVRLVKGAYWDAEVKRAQVEGLAGYPLFTRKQNTDVSYLANARRLLDAGDAVYPMFATHNAQTIATVHRMARAMRGRRDFEFQKLHGMGDDLYAEVIPADRLDVPCRVYAPVGSHEDLLPYLVRRLLENGANSSFVNRITDESISIDELIRDPVEAVSRFEPVPHPRIPLPVNLYRSQNQPRDNSMGLNFANDDQLRELAAAINNAGAGQWTAGPLVPGATVTGARTAVTNPADRREVVGHWQAADNATVERALQTAVAAHAGWDATPAGARAAILEHAADPAGSAPASLSGDVHQGSRQDPGGRRRRSARSRRFPALLRLAGARTFRADRAARPHRRIQSPATRRTRRVRLHLAVELPVGDLPRPDRGRAGRGQHGDRQARGTDQPDRLCRGAAAARGRHPARRCCSPCRATAPPSARH